MSDIVTVRSGLFTTLTTYVTGLSVNNCFRYAPSSPADSYPFGYLSMREGTISHGGDSNSPWRFAGIRETQHRVLFTLCFSLQTDLADAEKNAEAYVQRVVAAIDLHKGLSGSGNVADAVVEGYEVVEVKLRPSDPQSYYGLRFKLIVLELEEGSLVGA